MAVTVTIYPDLAATGYVSVDTFKAYCDQRLKVYAGKSDDEIGVAINEASEYIDSRFKFPGHREFAEQSREWPRLQAYDSRGDRVEGIPSELRNACCEYAFRALSQSLMADPTRDESGRVIKSKDEKVGPISESVEYAEHAGFAMPIYPFADNMLYRRGLVIRSGGVSINTIRRG